MSAVVEAVSDVVSSVTETVGNVVSDVVDTASHIVEQAGNVVTKAVDAAIADPIGTLAKVVAVGTGNAYLLPYITAADVVAHGGNLEDAVKAGAITWVAQGVTNYVSEQLDCCLVQMVQQHKQPT